MNEHLRSNGTSLYNASVRSKVTAENSDTACLCVRIVNWSDDVCILVYNTSDVFAECLSCTCHNICVDKTLLVEFIKNCVYTAGFIEVFHISVTCRSEVTEVRSLCADFICHVKVDCDSAFICNSREVEHAVC